MPSNAARGARWKARSRRFLEAQGYIVADLEIIRNVWTPIGIMPQKRDQWGSDLIAACGTRGYLWVQVKGFSTKKPSLAPARRTFAQFPRPPWTKKIIMLWKLGARAPEIVECA